LKTLEEPPEHVKFIFCTTEPSKVPVTILSRCQRFDFAGVRRESIAECLRRVVDAEGVDAEPAALDLLARRAAGSIRDGQSLLEQLLAFAPGRITEADVHGMLGSAGEERLAGLVGHLVDRKAAEALADLEAAVHEGVDVAQLLEQLFGYFRDCMAAAVGCPAETFLYASATSPGEVERAAERLGLQTVLAAMQILEQALSRLRFTTQGRIVAELALVRIATLEELDELPALIAELKGGSPPRVPGASRAAPPTSSSASRTPAKSGRPARASKQGAPPEDADSAQADRSEGPSAAACAVAEKTALTPENAVQVWNQALSQVSGLGARHAKDYARAAISAPNRLVISFRSAYTFSKSVCERPDQLAKFERALADLTGERIRVEFALIEDDPAETGPASPAVSPRQRRIEALRHPMIRRAIELFDAKPID